MKKSRKALWIDRKGIFLKRLSFSSLDSRCREYVNREVFCYNNRWIAVIAYFMLVVEAFNLLNVLFLSRSGLATANNRRYFILYLSLFLMGILCLILRRLMQKRRRLLYVFYLFFETFWIFWGAALTAMDLRSNSNITVYVTMTLATAVLIRMKPWEVLCIMPGGYSALLLCAGETISMGAAVNAAIVTLIAVLIICSRYINTLDEMKYRQKLIRQARFSREEKKKIRILCQQKEALLNYSKGWIFLWDRELNLLTCSGACQMAGEDKKALLAWLNACNMNTSQVVTWLNMRNGQDNAYTYLIKITPQVDMRRRVISAVGRITLLKKDEEPMPILSSIPVAAEYHYL